MISKNKQHTRTFASFNDDKVNPLISSNDKYKSLPILPRHVIDAEKRFRLCGGIVISMVDIIYCVCYIIIEVYMRREQSQLFIVSCREIIIALSGSLYYNSIVLLYKHSTPLLNALMSI